MTAPSRRPSSGPRQLRSSIRQLAPYNLTGYELWLFGEALISKYREIRVKTDPTTKSRLSQK
ncbi:hypothetical protein AGR3A_Cc190125 [Agrobacterium tomkonis CFBP 6623]|uniref:Uncharacterized protein n=1 Tax=Agrobacterium tomkonis CFBP 6623 TaxID=1183432 RepID=A0A1S7P2S7_9HYPH|nr:hypothetical protein AGR3A_Cc190125 [Agrobacterium tomkonis CFBP 6623]